MHDLLARLHALRLLVEQIRTTGGAAGVSIGVIHEAKVLCTDNFGYRDVERKVAPDEDTIYYLASLTKSFTAAGVAHLIRRKPAHEDKEIRSRATIADFLSHRTGLAPKNHLWSQEYGHFTLRRGEDIRTVTYLEKIAPFREKWIYNNWGYAVADELIEHLSGDSFGEFLKHHLFEPLRLRRTVTTRQPGDDNVAKGYFTLASGKPWHIEEPDGEDGEILSGALSVRSCVSDLMRYYIAFMQAVDQDDGTDVAIKGQCPIPDAARMIYPHIKLSTMSKDFTGTYGLGWATAQLPCAFGALSMNHAYVGKMPVVGEGLQEKATCYYHQGSANSFLSAVYLLPGTRSGVVVLTNSMARNDAADWIGELYLQTLIDAPRKVDYVRLATNSAEAALALWPGMQKELADNQIQGTPIRPLSDYVGLYYNRIGNYHIAILENDGQLLMRFQRERHIAYELTHYHYDTFSWLITHDQDAKLGRFPITRASFYLIEFVTDDSGHAQIDSLRWAHDDEVLAGERFIKRDGPSAHLIASHPSEHPEPSSKIPMALVRNLAAEDGTSIEVIEDPSMQAQEEVAIIQTELTEKTAADGVTGERSNNGEL